MERKSLPFKITGAYEGFAETEGLLRLDNTNITLQFQTVDAVFGMMKSAIKNISISINELETIEFRKRFWGNHIFMHISRLDLAQALPSQSSNQIKLKIARGDRTLAEDMVRAIRLQQSEYEYDQALKAS